MNIKVPQTGSKYRPVIHQKNISKCLMTCAEKWPQKGKSPESYLTLISPPRRTPVFSINRDTNKIMQLTLENGQHNLRFFSFYANIALDFVMLSKSYFQYVRFTKQVFFHHIIVLQNGLSVFNIKWDTIRINVFMGYKPQKYNYQPKLHI